MAHPILSEGQRCGVPIAEAIVETIRKNRKTLLIITESFLDDEWCYFTLQMALDKGLYHLVVVLLDDIDMKHRHSQLVCGVMDMLPYVKYIKRIMSQHFGGELDKTYSKVSILINI